MTRKEGKQAPAEAALAEVERLHQDELAWGERRAQIVARIAEAEASAGARVLDGGEDVLREQADSLVSFKAQIAGSDAAIQEVRRRRQAAVLAVFAADAAALRRQAQALRGEADERQKRIDELLRELLDFDGAIYIPAPSREAQLAALGVPSPPGALASASRTAALRVEADRLEAEADALEARPVTTAGALAAQAREELLARLHGLDPLTVGPTLASVVDWLELAEPPAQKQLRIRAAHGQGGVLSYELVWAGGELDKTRSRVSLNESAGATHRA